METHYEGVLVRRDGSIGELILNKAETRNALSTDMVQGLGRACADLADDESLRAVVVTSACDKAFCVGADLKERHAFTDADFVAQRPRFRRAFRNLLSLPMPVIAAVHGWALGGGFEIALSSDLIVADETAIVGLPEVVVGLIPGGGGTQLLTRRVGYAKAADLILTGRRVSVDEALRMGLVDRRAPAGRDIDIAFEIARMIAQNSPVGVRNAKHALRQGAEIDLYVALDVEDAAWRATALSADRKEGIAAFNEKRSPHWSETNSAGQLAP